MVSPLLVIYKMNQTPETSSFQPAYLRLLDNGELDHRIEKAYCRLERCELCGVRCRINRRAGKAGGCRTGDKAILASFDAHDGEEAPISGWAGSGAVFFAGCNLRCQFCQNYDISQTREGKEVEPEALAAVFLQLQSRGCHNINLVSPSHVIPMILSAVQIAARNGLRLPLVFNTGGYDYLDSLRLLDGVVDIYMPDMKYSNPQVARRYSKVINYPKTNQSAVREMFRQVGDLILDERGIAKRGLLVRHLVMPNGLAGTKEITRFLAEEISPNTYFNIMGQYNPAFEAKLYPSLNRHVTSQEFEEAVEIAQKAGLTRIQQE